MAPRSLLTLPARYTLSLVLFAALLLTGCRRGSPLPISTPASGDPTTALKIYALNEGIYRLSLEEIGADGLQVDDPSHLRLSRRGKTVPLWVSGSGSTATIAFYGQPSESIYTRESIYWLENGDQQGNRTVAVRDDPLDGWLPPASLQAPPGAFISKASYEQNLVYSPLVESGDHWLWQAIPAPQKAEFAFDLPGYAGGQAELAILVWGSTASAEPGADHHLEILVNGLPVADVTWEGKGRHGLQASIPAEALKEGGNQLAIFAVGDTGNAADVVSLDRFSIDYPCLYQALDDVLAFTSSGEAFQPGGFSGAIQAYDLDNPGAIQTIGAGERFQPLAGHRYWLVGAKGYLRPERIEPAQMQPHLRAASEGADYLAIGPVDLLAPLEQLLQQRQAQGLTTAAVPVEAIYDQFNAGYPEPEAIRAYVEYTRKAWKTVPRYLLLVGDGSYDPRGYTADASANRLPVFLVSTEFGGETASDLPFALADEAQIPSLAVGRVPAQTPEQIRTWVAKALAFEDSRVATSTPWRVFAIADGQDPTFSRDAQAFLDEIPSGSKADLLAPQAGSAGSAAAIRSGFQQGYDLVAYFGHGSINMWGKDRLFQIEDVRLLKNEASLPVVLNFTCLTGLFMHPKLESLAEALLWQPGGGAVAVLAPTSLTLPNDQSFLSGPLVEALAAGPGATIGEALLQAQRQMPLSSLSAQDVMRTFLLFGDPALRLR